MRLPASVGIKARDRFHKLSTRQIFHELRFLAEARETHNNATTAAGLAVLEARVADLERKTHNDPPKLDTDESGR
jgi:hypothetical protein